MADENWQKVREVFDAALQQEPEERQQYIHKACGADQKLLTEVESLFSSLAKSDEFLKTPAIAQLAEIIESQSRRLEPGTRFGHYEVIRQIGIGGMGEVYLAQDQKLDRRVAIKILNGEFSRDDSNLKRFVREAKAASALSHPNILVIHEIGQNEDTHYIVSEFIDGRTLREILKEGAVRLSEVLDVSIQIVNALAAAHAAHLVHRDIKPENIMVRPDGYVKVLDFGLAKLVEQKNRSFLGLENETRRQNQTAKGVILGTVNYMSPEQAKGEDVDERTDIFSLGVVIYEMIAGRTPFAGDSVSETFANLINVQALPLSRFSANVPNELQRIVAKMLRKNKDERFQTMKGLLTDLKDLRENLTTEEKLERSRAPASENPTVAFQAATAEAKQRTAATQQSLLQKIKLRKKTVLAMAVVLLTAALATGYYFLKRPKAALVFQAGEVKRLTTSGQVNQATISPDGKFVIYAQKENGEQQSLWLQHVGSENNLQIIPPAKIEYWGLDITPDGNTLYYIDGQLSLYRMGVVGGRPIKVADSVGYRFSSNKIGVSPDSKQIAFMRVFENRATAIFIANADGTNERRLAAFEAPIAVGTTVAWSPDGKVIACDYFKPGEGSNILAVQIADGTSAPISKEGWNQVDNVTWMVDSKSLFLTGKSKQTPGDADFSQIWQLSYPGGERRQITKDLNNYQGLGLTSDGQVLTALRTDQSALIWTMPDGKEGLVKQLNAGFEKVDGTYFVGWRPDNRIVYGSRTSGRESSWVIGMDGTDPQRLANNGGVETISPDGNYVIYTRYSVNEWWRMDLRNGSEKFMAATSYFWATFSPDGKWIVFTTDTDPFTLMKISSEGGEQTQVLGENVVCPAFSPDGKTIAVTTSRKVGWGIALVSFDGSKIIAKFEAQPETPESRGKRNLQWTPDGRAVNYVALHNGVSNIWRQPVDGSPPFQVTKFETGRIFNFSYSPDGKQLALSRGTLNSDVVLIKNSGFSAN